MDYRAVLVCLDGGESTGARLAFALRLAGAHAARLCALSIEHLAFDTLPASAALASAAEQFEADVRQRRQRERARFEEALGQHGLEGQWHVARASEADAIVTFARDFDLILLGEPEADSTAPLRNRILLGSGRPVLFLPAAGAQADRLTRAAVAWNGSREAARALADALPLLRQAEHIAVIAAPQPALSGGLPHPDPVRYLRRHGCAAAIELHPGKIDDQGLMTQLAALRDQTDLLVAGAWGHSRIGELILGGATRALLHEAGIPLLMSH